MSVLLADQPTVLPSFCEVVLATSDVNGASNVDGPGRAVAGVVAITLLVRVSFLCGCWQHSAAFTSLRCVRFDSAQTILRGLPKLVVKLNGDDALLSG